MEISRSYERLSAQIDWLLGQRGITERAVAEAIRGALAGQPAGPLFPRGSHENVVLRLACAWGLRAPWLDPRFLVMTPLELQAVSDGQTTLVKAFALVAELERRELPGTSLRERVRALVGDEAKSIETWWSADRAVLAPALAGFRERMQTPGASALLDEVSADVARLVAERAAPRDFKDDLRRAMLGERAAADAVVRAGLSQEQVTAAMEALRAAMSPADRFISMAVEACGNFDYGVETRVITAQLLGQYLQHLFLAIENRQPIPELGPPHLMGPLKWLCDLFVDACNADPTARAYCEQQAAQIGAGEATTAELAAALARRWIAAKGIDAVLAQVEALRR